MVMSKVSKAIAASFLCLTINAGGATNAMNEGPNQAEVQVNKEIKNNNINMIASPKKDVINIDEVGNKQNNVDNKQNENNNDNDNKDKTPDGEKSILRWLIPLIAGLGGLALGIGLGKFAL